MTEKKLDWDKPLQTMEGYDVVLLTKEFMYAGKSVYCVMIESVCGYSRTFLYRENGSPVTLSSPSIRNKTKKVVKWYNLYADKPGLVYMDSEEMARNSTLRDKPPLATLSFEMEVPCG
jgi:hypothetical protein